MREDDSAASGSWKNCMVDKQIPITNLFLNKFIEMASFHINLPVGWEFQMLGYRITRIRVTHVSQSSGH
jgi:hypothetical protein